MSYIGGCIATTQFLFRLSISGGFGVVLMRITEAFKNPRLSEITPLIRSDLDIPSSLWLRSAPAPGNPTPARPRMLSAPPRAQSPSRLSPTQPHAPEARAWSGCAAPAEAAPGAWTSSPRMLRCGARRLPVHQGPDASEIRLWVCGEQNATQTPFYRAPRK